MQKTGDQIEQYLYQEVKGSEIATAISGSVYRGGTRPLDATTEDAVVTFVEGFGEDIQQGYLNINIYISDLTIGTRTMRDIQRCSTLAYIAQQWVETLNKKQGSEYKFYLQNTIRAFEIAEAHQHFINIKLAFKHAID